MALILWSSDYKVDVDNLDADHIMIFSLINHIDESHQSGSDEYAIGRILKVLIDRAFAHFQREEMMMRRKSYPGYDSHVAEHQKIIDELQSLYEIYRETPSAAVSRESVELLSAGLEDHILVTDMQYRPYLADG